MEELSSSYPYSMDLLIDRKNRSLENFYKDVLIPLSFYNLGSVNDLLNMKQYELKQLRSCLKDKSIIKLHYDIIGIPLKQD